MYDIILPLIIPLILYIASFLLVEKKIIKKKFHVKIWNLIILIFFIVSGIGGFILAFLLSYNVTNPINNFLLYWHVEFGLGMLIVAIFHIHIYWKLTLRLFRK